MKKNNHTEKQNKSGVRLWGRPHYMIGLVLAIFMMVAGIGFFGYAQPKPAKLEFIVKPALAVEKTLDVWLTIESPRPKGKVISLYKGDNKPFDLFAENDQGRRLKIRMTDDLINISTTNRKAIKIFYRIKIAHLGKHGYQGQYYDNLLTFEGQQVLFLPLIVASGDDRTIQKAIAKISIKVIPPANWVAVMPFAQKEPLPTNGFVTEVTTPSWAKIYDLVKSAYTFGKLNQHSFPGEKLFSVYVDSEARTFYNNETFSALKSIYDFYTKLYGYKVPFTVVLLRKSPQNKGYIMGGSSTQTLATTFDPANRRDWELMGHRFGHAFFDHQVTSTKFHFPPYLWFYEGLITYYENQAMTSLPEQLRKKLRLDPSRSFLTLFRRYLYMRLKDPNRLAMAPMSEENISSAGRIEFLHYTQAPLLIKYIEDESYKNSGVSDRMLHYILDHKPEQFKLQSAFLWALGRKAPEFINRYLVHPDILPLWFLADGVQENPSQVIAELNDFEYTLWTWFRLEDSSYPQDQLALAGLAEQAANAERMGLRFAGAGIEAQVKRVSPTVYRLLKQYAFRAKAQGVELNDPLLRYKVISNSLKE